MSQGFRTLNLVRIINCVAEQMVNSDHVEFLAIVRKELTLLYNGVIDIADRMEAYPLAESVFFDKVEDKSVEVFSLLDEASIVRKLDQLEVQMVHFLKNIKTGNDEVAWGLNGTLSIVYR